MRPRKALEGVLVVAAATGLLWLSGCASSKNTNEFPKAVEANVQATQSEPDKIEYIEARPWSLSPGETVEFTMRANQGRNSTIDLTGIDGPAKGKTQQVTLAQKDPGVYTGSITAGENMPPGRYRIEGTIAGGPSGEPVTLVSSRALTVQAPPPPQVDACAEAAKALREPHIRFAYDKSDLDAQAKSYLAEVASRLQALGPRVVRVTVEGHCDERGTVNYNLALGARRASSVRDFLAQQSGIKSLKIDTLSKGKEEPLVPHATTEAEHSQNRRAVFDLQCNPAP